MRVAIHQPNLCPWYPFFAKMASVDVFVVMVHCQFEKGKYQNRFRLKDEWFTMSVNHGLEPINQKRYIDPVKDWFAIKARLPQFKHILSRMDLCVGESLHETNYDIIVMLRQMLGIKTEMVVDWPTNLRGTDRLVELCKFHTATTYVAGQSGHNYLDLEKFKAAGIAVEHQDLSNIDNRHALEVINEKALRESHP